MNAIVQQSAGELMESVIIKGDLANLTPIERANYYNTLCHSLGLNPLTQPFKYLLLDGKLTLYATKDCTEQLRKMDKISVTIVAREAVGGAYIVTARASTPDGRVDESIGAVPLEKEGGEWVQKQHGTGRFFKANGEWQALRGVELANAMMKAETKSKRRVTLSICGLGVLDETEVETIPNAVPFVEAETVPMQQLPAPQQAPTAAAPFMTNATWERLNTLAIKRYNGEWESKQNGFANHVSNKRTYDIMGLTEAEAQAAIEGLEKKLAEMKAAAETVPAPV